ncbi:MAG: hypothetical protein IPI53_10250 [Saprospiraceae bacterium]|nr:hypothetical protein [Saprospiraceae bacterium]
MMRTTILLISATPYRTVCTNPQNYPVIAANLTNTTKAHLENQIDVTNAEHNVKADFNGYLVDFYPKSVRLLHRRY